MTAPLHIISLGAGVQSSTMALMAAAGEITPMPHCAIFADTQDEPASVYKWLDWLIANLPYQVHKVTAGSLSEKSLIMRRTKDGRLFTTTNIPFFTKSANGTMGKIRMRGCTRDFKLAPIFKLIRDIVGKAALKLWRKKHRESIKVYRRWQREYRIAKKQSFPCQ